LKEFEYVFEELSRFSPKRDIDFSIEFIFGAAPVSKNPYRMSTPKLKEFQMQLEEFLKMGYMHPSISSLGVPVIFFNKKYGTMRLCIDFRQVNKVAVKKKYSLTSIEDIVYQMKGAMIFSKFELRSGYHQVRIREEYTRKTTI
jgi:hypothetical protein